MITLHTWTTPNGRKISIALEEMGLPYEVKPVNIGANAQFEPNFLAISPNNKIPAIVDHDAPGGAVTLFESGAILLHLAERTGRFLPASGAARAATLEWLFWQVGGVGPMFGQLGYFALRAPEKLPAAIERFREEALRLLGVMEKRLAAAPYLGGEYSIADMATYPWIVFGDEPDAAGTGGRGGAPAGHRPLAGGGRRPPGGAARHGHPKDRLRAAARGGRRFPGRLSANFLGLLAPWPCCPPHTPMLDARRRHKPGTITTHGTLARGLRRLYNLVWWRPGRSLRGRPLQPGR